MDTEAGGKTRRGNWNVLARAAVTFVLPSRCLACAERPLRAFLRGGVCEVCWGAIAPIAQPRCTICDEPVLAAEPGLCGRCLLDPPEFRRLTALSGYHGPARAILLAFKFRGADYLAPHLARELARRLPLPDTPDEVVSVPATRRDRRRRDHAAELLGIAVARALALPFSTTRLEKVRTTRRQSGLPLEERVANVRGAFRARRPSPQRVLLVDDVATSGSTARACAAALIRAGTETVDVWCFARASREDEVTQDRLLTAES
jgi:ComF family protein